VRSVRLADNRFLARRGADFEGSDKIDCRSEAYGKGGD